jgi:AraC family transcriptional regulator of adaptative response/methylated-DNA-[protein]-cysteine methyltransferase
MQDGVIRFDSVRCALGWLLVAGTERGVCNVRLGSRRDLLERELRDEFPFAELRRDAAGLAAWVEALRRCAEGRPAGCEVPLDVSGSRFERRVWRAIAAIPRSETRSYGELARALRRPAAARAVGRACGKNPVALAVPCHRVVRADGSDGGYRWGKRRKRSLLKAEQIKRE